MEKLPLLQLLRAPTFTKAPSHRDQDEEESEEDDDEDDEAVDVPNMTSAPAAAGKDAAILWRVAKA